MGGWWQQWHAWQPWHGSSGMAAVDECRCSECMKCACVALRQWTCAEVDMFSHVCGHRWCLTVVTVQVLQVVGFFAVFGRTVVLTTYIHVQTVYMCRTCTCTSDNIHAPQTTYRYTHTYVQAAYSIYIHQGKQTHPDCAGHEGGFILGKEPDIRQGDGPCCCQVPAFSCDMWQHTMMSTTDPCR